MSSPSMLSQTLLSPVSDFSQAQEKEDEGQGLESAGLVVELLGLFLCTSESFHKMFIHIRLQCCHLQNGHQLCVLYANSTTLVGARGLDSIIVGIAL